MKGNIVSEQFVFYFPNDEVKESSHYQRIKTDLQRVFGNESWVEPPQQSLFEYQNVFTNQQSKTSLKKFVDTLISTSSFTEDVIVVLVDVDSDAEIWLQQKEAAFSIMGSHSFLFFIEEYSFHHTNGQDVLDY